MPDSGGEFCHVRAGRTRGTPITPDEPCSFPAGERLPVGLRFPLLTTLRVPLRVQLAEKRVELLVEARAGGHRHGVTLGPPGQPADQRARLAGDQAAGRLDAFFERGLNYWDFAAGGLIAREAGAVVGGLAGQTESTSMAVAAGPGLYQQLDEFLTRLNPERDGQRSQERDA